VFVAGVRVVEFGSKPARRGLRRQAGAGSKLTTILLVFLERFHADTVHVFSAATVSGAERQCNSRTLATAVSILDNYQ